MIPERNPGRNPIQDTASQFKLITGSLEFNQFARQAERDAFLPTTAGELIKRLDEGKHGTAILYNGVTKGYILSSGEDCLVLFNNGQAFKGTRLDSRPHTITQYKQTFHNSLYIDVPSTQPEKEEILPDEAVARTLDVFRQRSMGITLSNDEPNQRDKLKQLFEDRLRVVESVERRIEVLFDLGAKTVVNQLTSECKDKALFISSINDDLNNLPTQESS